MMLMADGPEGDEERDVTLIRAGQSKGQHASECRCCVRGHTMYLIAIRRQTLAVSLLQHAGGCKPSLVPLTCCEHQEPVFLMTIPAAVGRASQ